MLQKIEKMYKFYNICVGQRTVIDKNIILEGKIKALGSL